MADDLQKKVTELTAENKDLQAKVAELTEKLQKVMKCGEQAQGLLGGATGDDVKEKTTDKAEEVVEEKKQDAQDAVKGALGSFF